LTLPEGTTYNFNTVYFQYRSLRRFHAFKSSTETCIATDSYVRITKESNIPWQANTTRASFF
jgi:hypothetical protein